MKIDHSRQFWNEGVQLSCTCKLEGTQNLDNQKLWNACVCSMNAYFLQLYEIVYTSTSADLQFIVVTFFLLEKIRYSWQMNVAQGLKTVA